MTKMKKIHITALSLWFSHFWQFSIAGKLYIDSDFDGLHEAVVLSDLSEHLECIEIQIKECKGRSVSNVFVNIHSYDKSRWNTSTSTYS